MLLGRPSLLGGVLRSRTPTTLSGAIRGLSSLPKISYRPADQSTREIAKEVASLEANELGRPLSPHLTIYEPQLTWLMSIGHRITGAGLSAGIYAFGIYYALVAPEAGQFTSQLASWLAHDCPTGLVYLGKYTLAAPFIYHTLNGIRHLVTLFF